MERFKKQVLEHKSMGLNDRNLELIVEQLEAHPALKGFYGFAYMDEIKGLTDSVNTSEVFPSSSIQGKPLTIRMGSDSYSLKFGKKINTQAISYHDLSDAERRNYKLRQWAATATFDDWMRQITSNGEIVQILQHTEYKYSVLARLDKLDQLGNIVSSRPLLLIPDFSPFGLEKTCQWEDENSTSNDFRAKLFQKAFSIQDGYKRLQARYDDAVLSFLQRAYNLLRVIRAPKL